MSAADKWSWKIYVFIICCFILPTLVETWISGFEQVIIFSSNVGIKEGCNDNTRENTIDPYPLCIRVFAVFI